MKQIYNKKQYNINNTIIPLRSFLFLKNRNKLWIPETRRYLGFVKHTNYISSGVPYKLENRHHILMQTEIKQYFMVRNPPYI
jgi:hypothetical protein